MNTNSFNIFTNIVFLGMDTSFAHNLLIKIIYNYTYDKYLSIHSRTLVGSTRHGIFNYSYIKNNKYSDCPNQASGPAVGTAVLGVLPYTYC